ncbi:MAG: glycosyltransferase [Phycisphaerales bacterium]|nr:glycosyltransferase [Phycisphaerales bacterium]
MPVSGEIALDHLDRLTDSTGLIQHGIYCLPRRDSGYTIDDNARALRLCVHLWGRRPERSMLSRITGYLSLLEYARRPGGGFHNLMSYQRQWLDTDSWGDCQGQSVRALAEVLGSELPDGYRALARELIDAVVPTLAELKSLRAQAYVILACGHLWSEAVPDIAALEHVAWCAAEHLVECYRRSRRPDWHWFESRMTYANAVMPHALFVAAAHWPDTPFLEVAEESLACLNQETTIDGLFWPVGSNGWYSRGESKAAYDQQPVEAGTMADAAVAAFRLHPTEGLRALYRRAHGWFYGQNSLGLALVDERTRGCYDGLQASGLNRNQGAESTLALLWTQVLHRDCGDVSGAATISPQTQA